jgi:hypothetical protein
VTTYEEIVELCKDPDEAGLNIKDVLKLVEMLQVIQADRIVIGAVRDKKKTWINLTVKDDISFNAIRNFIRELDEKEQRIIFTSATIGSRNYSNLLSSFTGIEKHIVFGPNGDPMKTCEKMLILADSGRINDNSKVKSGMVLNKDRIVEGIKNIFNKYPNDKIKVITYSTNNYKIVKRWIEKAGVEHKDYEVDYYNSTATIGTKEDARIMICIGMAYQPSNSCDAITDTFEDSKILRDESVQAHTYQAISRVKDPNGKEESIVFGIGCTQSMLEKVCKWGIERRISFKDGGNGRREVTVRDNGSIKYELAKPNIIKCEDINDMIEKAVEYKTPRIVSKENEFLSECTKINSLNLPKKTPFLLRYNNTQYFSSFCRSFLTVNNCDESKLLIVEDEILHEPNDLVRKLFYNTDDYARQELTKKREWGFKRQFMPVKELNFERHLAGDHTIGAYQFREDDTLSWICIDVDAHIKPKHTEEEIEQKFENAEIDREKLSDFLDNNLIPFVLEASGSPHSYHFWIFVKPVFGYIAKAFGDEIIKQSCIDTKTEMFPKQASIYDYLTDKKTGTLVKVPCGYNQKVDMFSTIFVNGEWTRKFTDLKIGVIDISQYPVNEECIESVNQSEYKYMNNKDSKIKPCVEAAVNMQLEEGDGNQMRIYVVREFYNHGMTNPEELTKLFEKQDDYIYEESLYHVNELLKRKDVYISCKKIRENCSRFINCSTCSRNNYSGERVNNTSVSCC